MNNCEKKLDALIDALGFSVEVVTSVAPVDGLLVKGHLSVDYKLTKRDAWSCDSGDKFTSTGDGVITYVGDTLFKGELRSGSDKYKMAYTTLRNQVQLHIDSGCLDVVSIDLSEQIKLCEKYANEDL